jgi:flavin reductase (DIM6/NTAB) family NADH-FMN oxidoreductase RutF
VTELTSSIDPRTLRDAFGAFPSGVVAVAASVKGQLTGIAASSFTSVSIDPPLVSFSIATSSSTWPLLREAGHVGISVLADHHDVLCRQLAGPREHRFDGLPFSVTEDGAVMLDQAVATYDCTIHDEIEAGDHVVVLLAVHGVGSGDGEHPLVFHRSGFAKLHRDDLDPARLDGRINGAEVDRGTEPPAIAPDEDAA